MTIRTLLMVSLLAGAASSRAEDALRRVNRRLAGSVVDHTHNHGVDRRIASEVLGCPRDMYVYLPPDYDVKKAYSVVLWFHGAFGDETSFLLGDDLVKLDKAIAQGSCKPIIVACPDGTYLGENKLTAKHSFYVNGNGGRFEDHIMTEIVPFLMTHYSIRPEREAHGIGGMSAGGFGAMSLAMRHRDFFSAVAVLSAPLNMRNNNDKDKYFKNFRPESYRWSTEYNPRQVVGRYYLIICLRAYQMIEHVFGDDEEVVSRIAEVNPADLLATSGIKEGDLKIYVNYSSHDNFNFDAHAESFAWLAELQGISLELERDNCARHLLRYFSRNKRKAFEWFRHELLPPVLKDECLSQNDKSN